jgi:P-type Mg2+ transporter
MDEIPYDFIRKKLTVLVEKEGNATMITKGALQSVLDVCTTVETKQGKIPLNDVAGADINRLYEDLGKQGLRILGLAYRDLGTRPGIDRRDEADMTFLGLIVFSDPLKRDIATTIGELRRLGVALKIITGDNRLVASSIGKQVGLQGAEIITGTDLSTLSDEALVKRVNSVDILAEVDPNQKERIVIALQKAGNVVGYIGDGINDASALHAADVGISVNSAADVAREAADIVLLDKDLRVLEQGIREGRTTFANTLKYVFMATSANFGNMFSMAGASLIMPFLPLLPKQILLTNLLTDMPEMTIATDNVDREMAEKPRRWDIRFIRNFMITFGLLSSVFDFATFGVLLFVLGASPEQFRAGWFVESVISASVIVLIIRTRRFFLRSRPGKYLVVATGAVVAAVLIIPYTALGTLFGFAPLPSYFLLLMGLIVIVYAGSAELAKKIFYRKYNL